MKNLTKIDYLGRIMLAHGRSLSTVNQYKSCLKNLSLFVDKDFSKVTQLEIQSFLIHRVVELNKSFSDENQHINSIKNFWLYILNKEVKPSFIKRPKQVKFIPNVLDNEQIERVIFNTENLKHRCILFTMYHNALRISELQKLTLMDARTRCSEPHLVIREAKGNESRVVYMEERCVNFIREYFREYKPKVFLFDGANYNMYSKTSINNILQKALKREHINLHIRVHDIRHSAATNALLNGSDIYHVSRWLGHKNLATTEKYYAHLRPDQIMIKRVPESRFLRKVL